MRWLCNEELLRRSTVLLLRCVFSSALFILFFLLSFSSIFLSFVSFTLSLLCFGFPVSPLFLSTYVLPWFLFFFMFVPSSLSGFLSFCSLFLFSFPLFLLFFFFFPKSFLKIFSLLNFFLPHWFCNLPFLFIRCRGRGSPYPVQIQGMVARAWVSYFFHNGGRLWLCQGRERRREKIFKIFLLPCLCTRRGRRKTILFKTTMFQVFLFFLIFLIIFFVFLKEKKMNLGVT